MTDVVGPVGAVGMLSADTPNVVANDVKNPAKKPCIRCYVLKSSLFILK